MTTYSSGGLAKLREEYAKFDDRRNKLFVSLFSLKLNSQSARSVLEKGVLRRLSLLAVSLREVFQLLPPEMEGLPEKEKVDLATINIHSFILNAYGLIDCWAHIWVKEFDIRNSKGKVLPHMRRGLTKGHKELRKALPIDVREYLSERDDWIDRFSELRHALAHNIPPYIPPNYVDPSNEAKYMRLLGLWYNTLDPDIRSNLQDEMDTISHWKAFLVYDLQKSPPIALHAQLIADFITIEEMSQKFLHAIQDMQERQ